MPSVQYLREFINERLTAAAAEIFSEFEKTIVQYEEVIDRQRRLLDITWKPEIKLHTDLPQQHVCKEEEEEEVPNEEQLWNEEKISSLDQEEPELPKIKEEQEELCTSQEGEQLALNEEINTFMVTAAYEESDYSEAEPDREQLLSHSSAERTQSQNQEGSSPLDPGASRSQSNNAEDSPVSESQCNPAAGEKPLTCDFCGKAFKNKSQMIDHHRVHTGEKPYSCETCGRSFTQKGTLTVHMRTHTGEKPYSCKICGKSCTVKSNLMVHMRTHTGEMPYLCNTCGDRFSDLSTYKRHTTVHTGETPYSCETCGKAFNRVSNLQRHMRTHTDERPYSCQTCGKMFTRSNHLLRHMKTHTVEESQ